MVFTLTIKGLTIHCDSLKYGDTDSLHKGILHTVTVHTQ